jgi:hypothetical protein
MRTLAAIAVALSTTLAHGAGFEIAPPSRGAARSASSPSAASNGDGFLVVWREGASSANGIAVDRSGRPATPEAFAVAASGYEGDVVAFGSNYLIATRSASGVLLLSEVTASGTLVRTFAPPPLASARFTASRDGRRIVLYNDVAILVLDAEGRTISTIAIPGGTVADLEIHPASGSDFLITAWRLGTPTVQRLSGTGAAGPVVALDEPVATTSQIAIVASETQDGNILAIWSERATPVEVNVAVVSTTGNLSRRTTLPYYGYPYFEPVALVRTTGNELVMVADIGKLAGEASDYLYIGAMRFNGSGEVLDPQPLTVTTSTLLRQSESVAFNGETFHVVTTESLGSGSRVKGVSFRLDNGVRNFREDLLSITRPEQRDPRVAAGDDAFLAVWRELSAEGDELKSARFTLGNSPFASEPLTISGATVIGEHAVASSGRQYLVVWQQGDQIRAFRVNATGTAVDTAPFIVRSGVVRSPAVTWNGTTYLVMWSESGRIFGATVGTDGAVSGTRDLTPRSALGGSDGPAQIEPSAAWDGAKYLIVWTLDRGNGVRDVRGAIVSAELISPAVSDVLIEADLFDPDITAGDGEFLVVGRRASSSSVAATFVDSNGFPRLTTAIDGMNASGGAAVAWDTRQFLIAYAPASERGSIRLARLTRTTSGETSRTESGVFVGAPDLAVNPRIAELAMVASELRSTSGSATTPRVVAFDEDRIDARDVNRRRSVRR